LRIIDQDNTIKKFKKLYSRVVSYNNANEDDLLWCGRILKDVENGVIPPKIDLLSANQIWKKYKV
jgi:hypothetical protein